MSSTQEAYALFFEKEAESFLALCKEIDASKYCTPFAEGKAHPTWLLGHVLGANNFLVHIVCCGGDDLLPAEWRPKFSPDFAGGLAPTPDAGFYPSWDELLERYEVVAQACAEGIRGLSDEALAADLPKGSLPDMLIDFFKTVDNTLRTVTLHSSYHRGQLSSIHLRD